MAEHGAAGARGHDMTVVRDALSAPVDACPMCGSYRRSRFSRFYDRCRACRTIYVNPRPRDDWLMRRLEEFAPPEGDAATLGGWSRVVDSERWKLDLLDDLDPPGKRLLDVGSGTGAFVAAAAEAGWEAEGHDLAPAVAAAARRDFGVTVHAVPLAELTGPYDLITLWDTLEHAPEPPAMLAELSRLLSRGGLLVILSPHGAGLSGRLFRGAWWVFGPTDHLVMFSAEALGTALKRAGLEVVELATRQVAPPYPPHAARPDRVGMRVFAWIHGQPRLLEALAYRGLGDWVFAVARRLGVPQELE